MSRNLLQRGEMPLIRSGNGINMKIFTNISVGKSLSLTHSYKERQIRQFHISLLKLWIWTSIISCGICRWKMRNSETRYCVTRKACEKESCLIDTCVYECVVSFSGFAESQTVCRAHLILIFTIFGISRKVANESNYHNLKIIQLARPKSHT